ncbi:MAG: copper amine oxidase N-terminal domain-containing protein, partial [Clostridiales bacterium]|nr:copper amine oxidase N-terminal domain-containing protein [Clostridiales bacterium]
SSSGRSSGKSTNVAAVTATTEEIDSETEATTEESTIDTDVRITIGERAVIIGGVSYEMDAEAYIQEESSSTLVPVRFASVAIGGGDVENADNSSMVQWDQATKTATITVDGITIQFTAGSNVMVVNGVGITMDNGVKAEIKDGRMYIPFRALGEALGVEVGWDSTTKTASYSVK